MSDSDSFIEEVTEEVRREKLYGYLRRYGWIGAVAVLVLVSGASYSEWRKAQAREQAEVLGDAVIAALSQPNATARAGAIATVEASTPTARGALDMIAAAELSAVGDISEAVARLDALAENGDVPQVYRDIAAFKSILSQATTMTRAERREGFSALSAPGHPLRLLAQEQLALITVESGDIEAAMTEFQSILSDAEASSDLQQRAMQVIVALGGEPDLSVLQAPAQN